MVANSSQRMGNPVAATGKSFTKGDTQKVKGLAIILMVIHHCFLDPERYAGQDVVFAPFSEPVFNWIALSFNICVALFVFISAYGITMSQRRLSPDYKLSARQSEVLVLKRLVSMVGGFLFVFLLAQAWSLLVVHDGRYLRVYGEGFLGVLYFVLDALGLAELFSTPTFLATFWYMSLAIIIVMLMIVLPRIYKTTGVVPLLFFAVLFRVLFVPSSDAHYCYLPNYLFCIVMGLWAAEENLIVRIDDAKVATGEVGSRAIKLLLALAVGALSLYLRQKTRYTALLPFWDGVIAVDTCYVMYGFVNHIPVVNFALDVLGKHSMNIFLAHNFVRVIWYYDFTYSFRYWWLITLVLLGISLALSVGIEALKRLTRYDKLIVILRGKCDVTGG